MNEIKVSVIIPVYNAEKYLNQCLHSVINQTLTEIEIICVDDGSTDNSADILRKYEKRDSRIRIITQNNSGAGAARNSGMGIATGEYLSFLDSDDFFEYDKLEKEYFKAKEHDADIVISLADKYYDNKEQFKKAPWITKIEHIPPYQPFSYRQLTNNPFDCFVGWAWDKLFRKDFIYKKELKFQEQRTTNDLYFTYSAIIEASRLAVVEKILSHQREDSEASLSKTREKSWRCFYDALIKLKEHLIEINRFDELERDFVNYALHFTLWNYNTLAEPTKSKLQEMLRNEWLANLGLLNRDDMYIYNQKGYKELINIMK